MKSSVEVRVALPFRHAPVLVEDDGFEVAQLLLGDVLGGEGGDRRLEDEAKLEQFPKTVSPGAEHAGHGIQSDLFSGFGDVRTRAASREQQAALGEGAKGFSHAVARDSEAKGEGSLGGQSVTDGPYALSEKLVNLGGDAVVAGVMEGWAGHWSYQISIGTTNITQ